MKNYYLTLITFFLVFNVYAQNQVIIKGKFEQYKAGQSIDAFEMNFRDNQRHPVKELVTKDDGT